MRPSLRLLGRLEFLRKFVFPFLPIYVVINAFWSLKLGWDLLSLRHVAYPKEIRSAFSCAFFGALLLASPLRLSLMAMFKSRSTWMTSPSWLRVLPTF
eukprot:1804794-Amphidinium_carterae.1